RVCPASRRLRRYAGARFRTHQSLFLALVASYGTRQCPPGARTAVDRSLGELEQALSAAAAGHDGFDLGAPTRARIPRGAGGLAGARGRHLFDTELWRGLAFSRPWATQRTRAAHQSPARHSFRCGAARAAELFRLDGAAQILHGL